MIKAGQKTYDALVIGAGPAGATTAAILAEHGHDVAILERESLPRHHVGESLIPAANQVLERLGLIEDLKQSSFPKKYSVQFIAASGRASDPFYFDDVDPIGLGHTWQVVRGEFDQMMVDRAQHLGAELYTGAKVSRVDFPTDELPIVSVRFGEPSLGQQELRARVVIDASGQSCFLSNRMGLRVPDPDLRNGTIWTWYQNASRDSGRDEGATIIYSSENQTSWFWFIPLPDNTVSIGCTGTMERMFGCGLTPEEAFERELDRCPPLRQRLVNASRTQPLRTTRDFSYHSSQAAGNNWVLVGDAYGFIDPVYSSGVFLALKSAQMAADAIHEGLSLGDLSAERLGAWKCDYDSGVDHFRRLVHAFYDPRFSFGRFMDRHPEHRDHLTDVLVGNVFKPELGPMFQAMEALRS